MTIKRTVLAVMLAGIVLLAATPSESQNERCCFNNFRFAGGCMVIPTGSETCASVLSALNNFNSVGNTYCDGTTVRGGWSLSDCGNPSQVSMDPVVSQSGGATRPIQPKQTAPRATSPQTAPAAQDATLLQVSAPLKVKLDGSFDSATDAAGQLVTGTLQEDLMDGDQVIAPAGSQVHARLVPTSFWTDGGGDSFEIQATALQIDDKVMPLSATAVSVKTSGSEVSVPSGSMVSFEAQTAEQNATEIQALRNASAAWMNAFEEKNAETIKAMYTDDVVLLPPNAPAIFGADAAGATALEMMNAGLVVELEDLELNVRGDFGYKAGRYRIRDADGEMVDRGKYIEIWTKEDGAWRMHRDIWNSSIQIEEDHDE